MAQENKRVLLFVCGVLACKTISIIFNGFQQEVASRILLQGEKEHNMLPSGFVSNIGCPKIT